MLLQSSLRCRLLEMKLAQRGVGQGRTATAILLLSSSRLTPLAVTPALSSSSSFSSFRIATVNTTTPHQFRGFITTSSVSQGFQQTPDHHQYFPQQPSRLRRVLRWFFRTLLLTGTGVGLGLSCYWLLATVSQEPFERNSPEDIEERIEIQAAAARLPLVAALLASSYWTSSSSPSSSSPPPQQHPGGDSDSGSGNRSRSHNRHHEAYAAIPPSSRPHRLTTGPLGISKGVGGYQHVFHNATTGEVLTVVYIGRATTGWPRVVHGGLMATLLDEQCARAAMDDVDFGGGGAKGEDNKKGGIVTARLELNYRQMTWSDDFYVIKARAVPEEELDEAERGKRARKVWVRTTFETVAGQVCVEGRALYVKPAGISLRTVGDDF